MLVAIGHVVGAIVAVLLLAIAHMWLAAWELQRNQTRRLEDVALRLRVPVRELDGPEHAPKILEVMAARYSSDQIANRISDLCAYIRFAWDGVGLLSQAGLLLGVIWFTISESTSHAVFAWGIPVLYVAFSIVGIAFALLCRLVTGRYPGEARQARKALIGHLDVMTQ